ncbi:MULTISPECIES: hypothetical protein [Microbacterium]|uniref:hypothetical protein n=1 Tax=Microbacterium TaxID=33882 RepID=UPI00277EEEAA|nr:MULTISPECIES: hypothetical protein [Microbacterium]MDQ1077121.1 hypothetical protein [Microbacterium sp. SORGH_AS_0969]MDQ1117364.1 hypothetical protein [Microbacterium testaceum]
MTTKVEGYRPPAFPLLEARFNRSENNTTRWLYGWNGLVTEAATDVTLAASAPAGRALVTSGLWADEWGVRIAALLAANSLDRSRLFRGIAIDAAANDVSWRPAPLSIDGESAQVAIGHVGDFTVAYAIDTPAQFAAAWRNDSELESLGVMDAAGYLIDPSQMHSYPSLHEQTMRVKSIVDFS